MLIWFDCKIQKCAAEIEGHTLTAFSHQIDLSNHHWNVNATDGKSINTIGMHYNVERGSIWYSNAKANQEIQNNDSRFRVFFFFFLGNGTEFSDKTLHFNSSTLHHHTVNVSSSTMSSFGHLNMNKSRDEKIHDFRAENQGESIRKVSPFKERVFKTKLVFTQSRLWSQLWIIQSQLTILPHRDFPARVLDQCTIIRLLPTPPFRQLKVPTEKKKDSHEKISAVDQKLKPGWSNCYLKPIAFFFNYYFGNQEIPLQILGSDKNLPLMRKP